MIPLIFLRDENIDRPKLSEQKNPFKCIVPLPHNPQLGWEQLCLRGSFIHFKSIFNNKVGESNYFKSS